jgi:lipopolysaccharide/colanic/teichoic acid biosynthesis glycosyltransferase
MKLFDLFVKNLFDFALSLLGLIFFFPVILLAWIVASIETKSNGMFLQQRVGKNGKLFTILKIKTMKMIEGVETCITQKNDVRITKSGAFFRRTKIDELPQLWNIFIGQMSFVGPRPDVKGYADKLEDDSRIILSIRPGVTGPASLRYRHEEELLSKQKDPKKFNNEVIWPAKIKININYIDNWSFFRDLHYIYLTITGKND